MIADMMIPVVSPRRATPQPSPLQQVSNFAAATQYRYRPAPVLTIIDMNPEPETGDKQVVPNDGEENAEKMMTELPSCLKFKPPPKNLKVMNLADDLDLTPTNDSNPRKSSVKFKHKTLEWVVNQSYYLTSRQERREVLLAEGQAPPSSQPINEIALIPTKSNVQAQEFNFTEIQDATNSRYRSLTGARADLNSAFSSIPWCYHGTEEAKQLNIPADNANMPNQLHVRSVRHLQKAHRTGISRPGTTTNSKTSSMDEIDELKRMSTPVLHQAVREAVSLGLMSVHESQVLLEVISRAGPDAFASEGGESAKSTPRTEYEEEEGEEPNVQETALAMIGLCDPTVGFEPVDITYRALTPPRSLHSLLVKPGQKKALVLSPCIDNATPAILSDRSCRSRVASLSDHGQDTSLDDSEGIDFGILGKDELKPGSVPATPRSPVEETPGCVARPCTAAESISTNDP